jgi:hypothetical protein
MAGSYEADAAVEIRQGAGSGGYTDGLPAQRHHFPRIIVVDQQQVQIAILVSKEETAVIASNRSPASEVHKVKGALHCAAKHSKMADALLSSHQDPTPQAYGQGNQQASTFAQAATVHRSLLRLNQILLLDAHMVCVKPACGSLAKG